MVTIILFGEAKVVVDIIPEPDNTTKSLIAKALLSAEFIKGFNKSSLNAGGIGCSYNKIKQWWDTIGPGAPNTKQYFNEHRDGRKVTWTLTNPTGEIYFKNQAKLNASMPFADDGQRVTSHPANDVEMIEAAVDILIKRHEHNWKGVLSLSQEWSAWPEWFILNRLGWLLSDNFYYKTNRQGSTGPVPFGWAPNTKLDTSKLLDILISDYKSHEYIL